jgi:hypothetical protein
VTLSSSLGGRRGEWALLKQLRGSHDAKLTCDKDEMHQHDPVIGSLLDPS